MDDLAMTAVKLTGGPADGDCIAVPSDQPVISRPCLGNGYAVYFRGPNNRYYYVGHRFEPSGEVVE